MTDEYMTLAEALQTKLPFKQKGDWEWISEPQHMFTLNLTQALLPIWQVQRPKPRMRVCVDKSNGNLYVKEAESMTKHNIDITETLKDILKDSE
jgi:hypothetical protein